MTYGGQCSFAGCTAVNVNSINHKYLLRVAVSETWLLLTVPAFCPLAEACCKKSAFRLSEWLI